MSVSTHLGEKRPSLELKIRTKQPLLFSRANECYTCTDFFDSCDVTDCFTVDKLSALDDDDCSDRSVVDVEADADVNVVIVDRPVV